MISTIVSLVPLLLTLALALLLRRTLVALGVGIVSGALLIQGFSPWPTLTYLVDTAWVQLYANDQWQSWHLNVLAAMILLGIMTQLLARGGAVTAFGDWLYHRIQSERQARLGVVVLGWLVFIDGIFSCLAVGHICQPLSERYGIRREQLAYLVDSNASPLCALLPFSSWGPYVMALLGSLSFLSLSPLTAFIDIAQLNFYAIVTLVLSVLVAWFGIGFRKPSYTRMETAQIDAGNPWLLSVPMLCLLTGSMLLMCYSGASQVNTWDITAWLSHADIGAAMRDASAIATLVTLVLLKLSGRGVTALALDLVHGARTMVFAISILMFTWMIGAVISDLGVAKMIAAWADIYLPSFMLVAGMFLLCAIMAFATGSSWGTFAIMIPIGGEVAHTLDVTLLIPTLSAVMAGSVFGDHCSPISDTSVLSATSSGCSPHDHVVSQLPFALIAAFSALVGFQCINLGGGYGVSLMLALMSGLTGLGLAHRLFTSRLAS